MTDFSKDINFLKPNINIDYNNISNVKFEKFLENLSFRYEIKTKEIELYNGISSAIYSILKFINLKTCYIYSPCSLLYKTAATNLNYKLKFVNRFENLYMPVKENSVVIFANPSYLDGTYYDLNNLIGYWNSKNATIIIDETLLDFSGQKSAKEYLSDLEKLFILKDYSKYYSNNTLSLASIFSNEKNIELLRIFEPEDKLSKYDMAYLKESLKDLDFKNISNSVNIGNRLEIEKIFHNCPFVDYLFHSSSNSLLIKLKNIDSIKFENLLKEKDIIIARCTQYDYIDESFINIYVSSREDITKLKEVIDAIKK